MSWYRTYRPTTISGLHLTHTRERLAQMLQSGSIPHALLFTGPRGTGKTSAARIVAAVLNDPANAPAVVQTFGDQGKTSSKKITTASTSVAFVEPHRDDPLVKRIFQGTALCVVELDAASYRGIDDVRALKEQVYLVPQEGSVNVFILDEVHMFTNEAWNALLKILEEPPTRVVFVLATTEVAKVPETIVSRCQVVSFHRASTTELSTALEHIFAAECITCDPAALERIVRQASGSFRDAVKWAEAIAQGKQRVTLDDVVTVLQCEHLKILVKTLYRSLI
jgi:DNA polymerase-3 subunit gamma/tau